MSDPNSTSSDILSDGPGKYILRPDICLSSGNTHVVTFIETIIVGNSWKINALSRLVIFWGRRRGCIPPCRVVAKRDGLEAGFQDGRQFLRIAVYLSNFFNLFQCFNFRGPLWQGPTMSACCLVPSQHVPGVTTLATEYGDYT